MLPWGFWQLCGFYGRMMCAVVCNTFCSFWAILQARWFPRSTNFLLVLFYALVLHTHNLISGLCRFEWQTLPHRWYLDNMCLIKNSSSDSCHLVSMQLFSIGLSSYCCIVCCLAKCEGNSSTGITSLYLAQFVVHFLFLISTCVKFVIVTASSNCSIGFNPCRRNILIPLGR